MMDDKQFDCDELVIDKGNLSYILSKIFDLQQRQDGVYIIYGPDDAFEITFDQTHAIVFVPTNLRDEALSTEIPNRCFESLWYPVYDVELAKNIIEVAYKEKPNLSFADKVRALDYYMEYDAFISFD